MLFALQNADLALTHDLPKPSYVVDRDSRVFASMVDHDWAIDVFVAEADALLRFKADNEIGRRVCMRRGAVPDCKCEAFIIRTLAFTFDHCEFLLQALRLLIIGVGRAR